MDPVPPSPSTRLRITESFSQPLPGKIQLANIPPDIINCIEIMKSMLAEIDAALHHEGDDRHGNMLPARLPADMNFASLFDENKTGEIVQPKRKRNKTLRDLTLVERAALQFDQALHQVPGDFRANMRGVSFYCSEHVTDKGLGHVTIDVSGMDEDGELTALPGLTLNATLPTTKYPFKQVFVIDGEIPPRNSVYMPVLPILTTGKINGISSTEVFAPAVKRAARVYDVKNQRNFDSLEPDKTQGGMDPSTCSPGVRLEYPQTIPFRAGLSMPVLNGLTFLDAAGNQERKEERASPRLIYCRDADEQQRPNEARATVILRAAAM